MNIEELNFDEHYTKGWTDEQLWRDFYASMWYRPTDFFEMDCIIRAQDAERPPVASRVVATKTDYLYLFDEIILDPPSFDSDQRKTEFQQLQDLVELRDVPLTALPKSLLETLRELSIFAKYQTIRPYMKGVDYMTNRDDYESVQRGERQAPPQYANSIEEPLITGRHLATFVHVDNPMNNWMPAVDHLLRNGIRMRTEFSPYSTEDHASEGFVVWGGPELYGLLGIALRECGKISFRQKWWTLIARPEEYGVKSGRGLLPQTFPEGSPMHPSFNAMHAFAAYVMGYLLLEFFDNHAELESGKTVKEEIELWAANIADARMWAGVHFLSDNEMVKPRARALAKAIAKEALGVAA